MKISNRQKISLVSMIIFIICIFLGEVGFTEEKPELQKKKKEPKMQIICTTADLNLEYEIIGVITHYQEFAAFGFKDPLVGALNKGMEKFQENVIQAGGDAVVGLRYNFANRTQKDEGRLLIYGTAVKIKK